MGMLVLSGSALNALASGALACSPAIKAGFVLTDIHDGRPGTVYMPTSYNDTTTITADLNKTTNPTIDTDTTGWTSAVSGTAAATRTTTAGEFVGVGALKCVGGTGVATWYQDITVRAGSRYQLDLQMRGDGASGNGVVRIFNLTTGNWLAAGGGSWASAAADAITGPTAAAFEQKTVPFQVESYQACRSDTVTIRVHLRAQASETAMFDDVLLYPGIDFASVHGHSIDPRWTVTLRSSIDNFSASDTAEATLTTAQPAFYSLLSAPVYRRYWRLRLSWGGTSPTGTFSPAVPMIGEWVLGLATAPTVEFLGPRLQAHGLREAMPQIRNESSVGVVGVTNLLRRPVPTLTLPFKAFTASRWLELRTDLWERSGCGLYPVVLVPETGEGTVIYGLLRSVSEPQRVGGVTAPWYNGTIEIAGLPGPAVGL